MTSGPIAMRVVVAGQAERRSNGAGGCGQDRPRALAGGVMSGGPHAGLRDCPIAVHLGFAVRSGRDENRRPTMRPSS